MAGKFGSMTPYNFAFNDPVYWNDPTGAAPLFKSTYWEGQMAMGQNYAGQIMDTGVFGGVGRQTSSGTMGFFHSFNQRTSDMAYIQWAVSSANFSIGHLTSSTTSQYYYYTNAQSPMNLGVREVTKWNFSTLKPELSSLLPNEQLTMQQVADQINSAGEEGIGVFMRFILDKKYGPEFFTESIRSRPETRGSSSGLVPPSLAFGLKTAAWGHNYFGANDQIRHIIGSFMMAENYGAITADNITTGNEYFGLFSIDLPNLLLKGRKSAAFEVDDITNNRAGLLLWMTYSIAKKLK